MVVCLRCGGGFDLGRSVREGRGEVVGLGNLAGRDTWVQMCSVGK